MSVRFRLANLVITSKTLLLGRSVFSPRILFIAVFIVGIERFDSGAKVPSGLRILQPLAPHFELWRIWLTIISRVSSLTMVSGLMISVNSPMARSKPWLFAFPKPKFFHFEYKLPVEIFVLDTTRNHHCYYYQ